MNAHRREEGRREDPLPAETKCSEEELLRKGWTRRFEAEEPKLSESVALYESLGFEVAVRRLGREEIEDWNCARCLAADPGRFGVIYTRKKSPPF